MVKVTFKPWEEVIIHESIYYSLEDLVRLCSIGARPGGLTAPLRWAEGVVFRASGLPPTEDVIEEMLKGKIHWNVVEWALMPEYKDIIPISEINARIPIINVGATKALSEVAKVLKKQVPK